MISMADLKEYKVKIIFLLHFILTCLACLGAWESDGMFFYNFVLLLCLIWGQFRPRNEEPIQLAVVVNVVSIFFDLGLISGNFPPSYWPNQFYAAIMCIIILICRFGTSYFLAKESQERLGKMGPLTINDLFSNKSISHDVNIKNTPSPEASQQNFGILAIS